MYVSRHDWAHHELQVHRREYVCNECDQRCPTRQEASAHLVEHYGETKLPGQLRVILDLSERQVDISLEQKEPCLVCGEELSLLALQSHLAGHMEDISLFVLPNTEEDEETGDSNASVQVAKIDSRGKASDLDPDSRSLGFSAAGDHGQNPLDFAKMLLGDEEAGFADKFSSWEADDEDRTPAADADDQNGTPISESDGEDSMWTSLADDEDNLPPMRPTPRSKSSAMGRITISRP
ncbi:hypothetical protein IMZ48_45305, partial [Candidatus Bathyarchaeota archaeon]|nr:hypothetical protein [Candidatus Bathyarchaeota archaeon]